MNDIYHIYHIYHKLEDFISTLLKVSKSQKHFSWDSIAQNTNEISDKILP